MPQPKQYDTPAERLRAFRERQKTADHKVAAEESIASVPAIGKWSADQRRSFNEGSMHALPALKIIPSPVPPRSPVLDAILASGQSLASDYATYYPAA